MSAYQTRVMLMQIVRIQLGALPVNVDMDLMVMDWLVQVWYLFIIDTMYGISDEPLQTGF